MKKIAFLGSKKIGLECLRSLYKRQNELGIKIDCVLTNSRGESILEFCKQNTIIVVNSLSELLKRDDFDIGISVQYHKILKIEHIAKARDLFINLHMAPLPEYRGCNQFSFAIINEDLIFGTTIHRLEEGIDSGDILFEKRFPIPKNCWVDELYDLTYKHSVELFNQSLPKIISQSYKFKPQKSFQNKRRSRIHYRSEIDNIKNIDLSWDKEKIYRHIRATFMPGFEPPFTILHDQKIFLTKDCKKK